MKRPNTPVVQMNQSEGNSDENILKNFTLFMKQVIDTQNDSFLSGKKNIVQYILSKYLGVSENELENLKKLSIIITNNYGMLNQFGTFLPNLQILKLNNSNILTFEDIGTNFNTIRCLQMRHCHLKDLNGIVCMQNLEILDVEDNEIFDLIDIEMCSNLKKINLRKNKIKDYENLLFLSGVEKLEYVCLIENPICEKSDFVSRAKEEFANVSHYVIKNEDQGKIQDIVGDYDKTIIGFSRELKPSIKAKDDYQSFIVSSPEKPRENKPKPEPKKEEPKKIEQPREPLKEIKKTGCQKHLHEKEAIKQIVQQKKPVKNEPKKITLKEEPRKQIPKEKPPVKNEFPKKEEPKKIQPKKEEISQPKQINKEQNAPKVEEKKETEKQNIPKVETKKKELIKEEPKEPKREIIPGELEIVKKPIEKEIVPTQPKIEPEKKEIISKEPEIKKEEPKKEEIIPKKQEVKNEPVKKPEIIKEEPKKEEIIPKKQEVKNEEPVKKPETKEEEPKKEEIVPKKQEIKNIEPVTKQEIKKEEPKKEEITLKKQEVKNEESIKKPEIKAEEPKKEEIIIPKTQEIKNAEPVKKPETKAEEPKKEVKAEEAKKVKIVIKKSENKKEEPKRQYIRIEPKIKPREEIKIKDVEKERQIKKGVERDPRPNSEGDNNGLVSGLPNYQSSTKTPREGQTVLKSKVEIDASAEAQKNAPKTTFAHSKIKLKTPSFFNSGNSFKFKLSNQGATLLKTAELGQGKVEPIKLRENEHKQNPPTFAKSLLKLNNLQQNQGHELDQSQNGKLMPNKFKPTLLLNKKKDIE